MKRTILVCMVLVFAGNTLFAQKTEEHVFAAIQPEFASGVNAIIDYNLTGETLDYFTLPQEYNQDLRNLRTLWMNFFPLEIWLKVDPGAKGEVALAIGEKEKGKKLINVFINNELKLSNIDCYEPIAGKNKPHILLLQAEDISKTGIIHIRLICPSNSLNSTASIGALWWFKNGRLTQEEANQLLFVKNNLHPDLYLPAVTKLDALKARDLSRKKDSLVVEMAKQGLLMKTKGLKTLHQFVNTENKVLNSLADSIYGNCVLNHLHDPVLPYLPNKWFNPAVPSYFGQWVWDTQFVLTVYAALGEDSIIRGVYKNYQNAIETNPLAPKGSYRYGMVPNFISPLSYGHPYFNSQLPNLAWGCLTVFRQTNDKKLLEECFPWLVDFYNWYSTERDVDNDGLIEYGSYNEAVQYARFESFDDESPTDNMQLTKHPKRAESGYWYGNVESVLLTCFMVQSERALVEMARELGKDEIALEFERRIQKRTTAMQKKMWDPKRKFFFNLERDNDKIIPIRTIQGFLTLTAKVATPEQAEMLVKQLQDTTQWWCKYPIPTQAMDEPTYQKQSFWRGDVWPPVDYMVTQGLNNYGYIDIAKKLTDKIVGLWGKKGINECYDGTTGQPLREYNLGMSSAMWNMVVQNTYGVQDDYRTIIVPINAKGLELKQGKLKLSYPNDESVKLKSDFDRTFHVVFPYKINALNITLSGNGEKIESKYIHLQNNTIEFNAHANMEYTLNVPNNKKLK